MTGDDERISDVDRRSMRILATSTKAAGPANARIADRLERAAGTGDPDDYRKAEASFDSLPAIERRRIGTHAEKQAVTQRKLEDARKRRPGEPKAPRKPAPSVDDTLDWKPLLLNHSPATDGPDEPDWKPVRAATAAPPVTLPAGPRPASPAAAPSVPRPAGSRAAPPATAAAKPGIPGKPAGATRGPAAAPARPKKPLMTLEPEPEVAAAPPDDDADDRGWDWQRVPEDPVLKATRRKTATLDPIEELRRQMLGDDTKRR